MGYIVALLIFLCGLIFRRSTIMTILMCSYMWMLVGLNVASPDYVTYEYIYDNISVLGKAFEPTFRLFCVLCKEYLYLNYQEFRMLYSLLMVIIIYKTVIMYTVNVNFVLSLFLLMPFIGFVSGIRVGLSLLVASYCFRYILEYEKYSILKYLLGILFASSIHFNSLFFIVFPICKYIKTKLLLACLLLAPIILFAYYNGLIYKIISFLPLPARVLDWFIRDWSLHIKTKVVLILFILQFLVIYLLYIAIMNICRCKKNHTQVFCIDKSINFRAFDSSKERYTLWLKANYLTLFLVPLYYVNIEFFRVFMGMLLVNYLIIANILLSRRCTKLYPMMMTISKNMAMLLLILLSLFLFCFYLLFTDAFLPAVLQNNMLFCKISCLNK